MSIRADAGKRSAGSGFAWRIGPRATPLALVAVLGALVASCAHRPGGPGGRTTALAGYGERLDPLDAAARSALRGRRVAIDPGHGGVFRGSVGVAGLTEAAVNLGVALQLKLLLETDGAQVLLTRETDRDFLTADDSTLRADLDARMRIANAFEPDVFVSIHHNADAGGRHDVNETQTYWKLTDDGASSELGRDLHRALTRNLGIGADRLLPGNYAVLRASEAPAVLTESSYLTFPPTEKRLRTDRALRLEAEAMLLGLANYFARGAPSIRTFGAGPDADHATLVAEIDGSFDDVELRIADVRVPMRRDAAPDGSVTRLVWEDDGALRGGEHEAALRVRRAGAGSSALRHARVRLTRRARTFAVDAWPRTLGASGGPAVARVRALDRFGHPLSGTLAVRLVADDRADAPRDTLVVLRDGVGWATLRVGPSRLARSTRAAAAFRIAEPPSMVAGLAAAEGKFAITLGAASGELSDVRLLPDGLPFGPLPRDLPPGPRTSDEWLTGIGIGELTRDSTGALVVPPLPGFRPVPGPSPPHWAAWFGGALHGRRIALDPEGSGDVPGLPGRDPAGQSASGVRAADLNLDVARALGAMLEACGAEVLLVRDSATPVLDVERVRRAELFRAERFLRIGHGPRRPALGHYPSSAAGRKWAERASRTLAELGLPSVAPGENATWAVQQTSAVALAASLGRIDVPSDEQRLFAPGTLRAEAYALLVSLAREWASDAPWFVDSVRVQTAAGAPIAGAPVTLGGALVLETDARGVARFMRTEAAPILVEAEVAGRKLRELLLESTRGLTLTGRH